LKVTQGLSDQIDGLFSKQQDAVSKIKSAHGKGKELGERAKQLEMENHSLKTSRDELKSKLDNVTKQLEQAEELKGTFAWTKAALDSALGTQEEYRKGYKSMRAALKKATEDFDKFRDEIAKHQAEKKEMDAMKERFVVLHERQKKGTKSIVDRMFAEARIKCLAEMIVEWRFGSKVAKQHRLEEEEAKKIAYEKKIAELEYQRVMNEKKEVAKRTLARMDAGKTTGLVAMCFSSWSQTIREEKSAREAEKLRKEIEERMSGLQSRKKDEAKSVLDRMAKASDTGLIGALFQEWKGIWSEGFADREQRKMEKLAAEKLQEQMKEKSKKAQAVMAKMSSATENGLRDMTFRSWASWAVSERRERKLASEAEEKLKAFHAQKKNQATSVVERSQLRKGKELVQNAFTGWITACANEKELREIHDKNKARAAELNEELNNLKSELEDKTDEIEDVQEELAETRAKNQKLRAQLAKIGENEKKLIDGLDDLLKMDS